MKSPQKVQRITIDERLAEDIIRILVADLKPGEEMLGDDPKCWEDEVERLVGPEDWEKMGIPEGAAGEWSWDNLHEGQVCYVGVELHQKSMKGDADMFTAAKKQKIGFLDIDEQSKEQVKERYLTALEGGG